MNNPLKILVVDDHLGICITIRDILHNFGYDVEIAENGFEGLALISQGFDCVISDLVMPGMNGVDFRNKVIEQIGVIPFIFITAYAEPKVLSQVNQLEGTSLIEKPITISGLINILNGLFPQKTTDQNFEI